MIEINAVSSDPLMLPQKRYSSCYLTSTVDVVATEWSALVSLLAVISCLQKSERVDRDDTPLQPWAKGHGYAIGQNSVEPGQMEDQEY